jgi:hypothetical protein
MFMPTEKANPVGLENNMAINIQPSHKGLLHKNLGIAQSKPIPTATLRSKMKNASPAVKKRLVFAMNARRWGKGK